MAGWNVIWDPFLTPNHLVRYSKRRQRHKQEEKVEEDEELVEGGVECLSKMLGVIYLKVSRLLFGNNFTIHNR